LLEVFAANRVEYASQEIIVNEEISMAGITATTGASQQKLDFMNLLIEELRNQNPLEPMNNQQMAAQMAQFSQLEQSENMNTNLHTINETIEKLNTSFAGAMMVQQFEYARSLLGQNVTFGMKGANAMYSGKAEKVRVVQGQPILDVRIKLNTNGSSTETVVPVGLEQIMEIAAE
jgi:flagellar hook assembly protein FlgD